MDIPFSDALLDDGSTEPIALELEKAQIDWMQSRAKAKSTSVDQVARYVIDWFMRHEDAPRDSEQSEASPDPKSLLNRLQKTKERLEMLREGDSSASDSTASADDDAASTSTSSEDDAPTSMFDMARTPSESEDREEDDPAFPSSELSPPKADVETHFGGPWSTEEMKKMKAALGRIEADRPSGSAPASPVWICTAVGSKGETVFYFATRQKTDRVFRAETCVDLINQIAQSVNDPT